MNRSERRARKQKAIKHAFDVIWIKWGLNKPLFNKIYNILTRKHEIIYVDSVEERYELEEKHREKLLKDAKLLADNLKRCSCHICCGHKNTLSYKDKKEQIRMEDELEDLDDI